MGRFKELLESKKTLILHGALGTELESRGCDVSGKLWSAKYLIEDPAAIQTIHEDYIRAGADIVTTSTYQATLQGLAQVGVSESQTEDLIRLTVQLAKAAREQVWKSLTKEEKSERIYPLISGDVGPYAAFLADGSEYTGLYDIDKQGLKNFHRHRIELLLDEGVDILALETIQTLRRLRLLLSYLPRISLRLRLICHSPLKMVRPSQMVVLLQTWRKLLMLAHRSWRWALTVQVHR